MEQRNIPLIGGDPGGLSAALHLTKIAPHLAHRILILEKQRYLRFNMLNWSRQTE
ncbi:MAG: hypothetical protein HYZ23_07930 [Chloroflexi bacterium]|nr:hypothetical protein [Chloroflexota bacterium]